MTLGIGTRLASYDITGVIGAGGMGEVYRARDTRLNRDVAIKILPDLFAADPERLKRFEREAQTLAALNHPNIAQIYGIVDVPTVAQGVRPVCDGAALVMEFIEGEDLAQRIARGAIPFDDAIPIARQIADALEAAHDKGIIHRDLKPANIKVRPDGVVKILDFGLAKTMAACPEGLRADDVAQRVSPALANSPTFTSPAMMTATGIVLGTAAYMAPEQARGKTVDKRADIWAFGCVLFEMLCGRRPFAGAELTDVLAAIVRDAPDLSALPLETPRAIRHLIERCLEKDVRERLRDVGEARIALAHPMRPDTVAAPEPSRARTLIAVAAVAILAGTGLAWLLLPRGGDVPPAIASLRQLSEAPGAEINPDISPDGRQVLYAAGPEPARDLYLLRVGGGRAIKLTAGSGSDNVEGAFSPDGERIAFRSSRDGGGLFIMGATGESVRRLTSSGADPRWSPDGARLAYATEPVVDPYSRLTRSSLWIVDMASGNSTKLWDGDAVQPAWSPNGQRIAFWANTEGQRDIWTIAASGGPPVSVTHDAATDWAPEWSPDGRWIYFVSDRGGSPNLWRVRIDETTGGISGAQEPVTNGVRAIASARFSRDGSRMVLGAVDRRFDLSLADFDRAHPETGAVRQTIRSASLGWCAPSRDASWLACTSRAGQEDIVLLRADGSETRRLTDDEARDRIPVWSPDDKAIVFLSRRSGVWDLWRIGVDGAGLRQVTTNAGVTWCAFSPDGARVAIPVYARTSFGFRFVDVTQTPTATSPVTPSTARMDVDSWSSDGALLAGTEGDGAGNPLRLIVWDLSAQRVRLRLDLPLQRSSSLSASFVPGTHDVLVNTLEGITLVNGDTGAWRVIRRMDPPIETRISGDGRTLLIERAGIEEDLWLMEFKGR